MGTFVGVVEYLHSLLQIHLNGVHIDVDTCLKGLVFIFLN